MSILATVKDVLRRPRRLPDKPSELIRVALADIRLVEEDDRYVMDMDDWHSLRPHNTYKCHVCVAGAVMAKSLKAKRLEYVSPKNYSPSVRKKLVALDNFRSGHINNGLAIMELPQTSNRIFNITAYEDDRELFHEDMNDLATYLESIGL